MRRRSWTKLVVGLVIVLYIAPPANSMHSPREAAQLTSHQLDALLMNTAHPENLLVAAIDAIRNTQLDQAHQIIDKLLERFPSYRLAYLIKGDLLLAKTQRLSGFGNTQKPANSIDDLRQEALARLQRYQLPPPIEQIPANLLVLSSEYAVLIDTSSSRLYLYRSQQGIPQYVRDFYITIGKLGDGKHREGDQKTPLGVYAVTGQLSRTQLDKTYGTQADLYGVGAWPISYPNEWDKRIGRDGHGIWLHGSPSDTYSRPPQASNGCVVLTNPDMSWLSNYLGVDTPVIITRQITWLSREAWQQQHQQALAQIETWRNDWESLDIHRYLAHYGQNFSRKGSDLQRWKAQKINIHRHKRWSKIKLEHINLFRYPIEQGMFVATFKQDYRSNNFNHLMQKKLYWQQQQGQWKIVYEGAAS